MTVFIYAFHYAIQFALNFHYVIVSSGIYGYAIEFRDNVLYAIISVGTFKQYKYATVYCEDYYAIVCSDTFNLAY